MPNSDYKSSKICVTGGTGSFGTTMINYLLTQEIEEIRIFSRDENKQDILRNKLRDERCKFIIGDTRNLSSVQDALNGVDYVFHAAALKQVPSCEFFPEEAVATNILGSQNVILASLRSGVRSLVCLSTDKAVYPINAMGMSKAIMERTAQALARRNLNGPTNIAVTRYGNVMMSRGSVIPKFIEQIKSNQPLTITSPQMTRFLMSLQDSVQLVDFAFKNDGNGELFIKKAPACTVETLAWAVWRIFGTGKNPNIEIIGIRHGEKQHETLLGTEELARSVDCGDYFKIPLDTRSLDYQSFFSVGSPEYGNDMESFNSSNTQQLDENQVVDLLLSLPEIKRLIGE